MGNTESNESNAARSSEEDSARRRRENLTTAVFAVTAVATVAAAGWAVTKHLSSSASEEEYEKTNDKRKSTVAIGTSRGYRIPSNEFEDSNSDSEDEETDEECQIKEGLTRRDQQISGKPICPHFPGYRKVKLNTDGSVKRLIKNKDGSVKYYINPPQAGFGGVIRDERGSLIVGFYGRLKDGCEVLEAELWGIYKGLEIIRGCNLRKVEIESDSKSAIHLIKDDTAYKKSPLKELVEKCKSMKQETGCTLKHTPREGNIVADKLAKGGRDQYDSFFTFTTPPNKSIRGLLAKDVASASSY